MPEGLLVQPREIDDWPDHKVVIISTGSQGEPLSALRRMAHRDHPQVELHDGDTVVFSRHADPGQRARGQRDDRPALPHRLRRDHDADAPIHASGHGYAEEIKLMLNLTRPRYVMPFHGDHKRIHLHARLAEAVGIDPDAIFKGENGLPLEIDERGARVRAQEQSGMIFVDGVDIGDRPTSRCATGACSPPTASSSSSPRSPSRTAPRSPSPRSSSAACRSPRRPTSCSTRCATPSTRSLERAAKEEIREIDLLQQILHDDLAAFVYERLRRRPMVLPVVVEV